MAYGNRRAAPMPYNNNFGATYMDGPQSSEPTKEHTEWARKRSKAQKDLRAHVNWLNDLRKEVTAYAPPASTGADNGAVTKTAGTGEGVV